MRTALAHLLNNPGPFTLLKKKYAKAVLTAEAWQKKINVMNNIVITASLCELASCSEC